MYKSTNPQRTLFEVDRCLPERMAELLKGALAEGFAAKIFPLLLEAEVGFKDLYCSDNGRPNWSIARMLGLCILQEMHNFPGQDALSCFSFDARWHYALGVEPKDAYLSRRSLVDFRSRMVEKDPGMKMLRSVFHRIGDAAIADLKISTEEQRLDSTVIQSNIATYGRIDLFNKTLFNFLRWLQQKYPQKHAGLSAEIKKWHSQHSDEGWFGNNCRISQDKKRAKLQQVAEYLYDIKVRFESDQEICGVEPYHLACRLLDEHCEIGVPQDDDADDGNMPSAEGNHGSEGTPEPKIILLKKVKNASTSMQSPYDPDAGYSGYKGIGYFVHVTESCNNESKEIITDYFVVHAGIDMNQDQTAIDNLRSAGKQPKRLYEDAGYISSAGLLKAKEAGTQLVAPIPLKNQPKDAICRDQFQFDTEGHCVACPMGEAPELHGMRTSSSKPDPALHAFFDAETCKQCSCLKRCMVRPPNNKKSKLYHIEIDPALIEKDRLKTEQSDIRWWERYKIRAGIEATMSELKRVNGIGRLRVRRKPRVTLAVSLKITACNAKRWIAAAIVISGHGKPDSPNNSFSKRIIAIIIILRRHGVYELKNAC